MLCTKKDERELMQLVSQWEIQHSTHRKDHSLFHDTHRKDLSLSLSLSLSLIQDTHSSQSYGSKHILMRAITHSKRESCRAAVGNGAHTHACTHAHSHTTCREGMHTPTGSTDIHPASKHMYTQRLNPSILPGDLPHPSPHLDF